jgi:hypothetical protein
MEVRNNVKSAAEHQLACAKLMHGEDLRRGLSQVDLPYSLDRKYPGVASEWV